MENTSTLQVHVGASLDSDVGAKIPAPVVWSRLLILLRWKSKVFLHGCALICLKTSGCEPLQDRDRSCTLCFHVQALCRIGCCHSLLPRYCLLLRLGSRAGDLPHCFADDYASRCDAHVGHYKALPNSLLEMLFTPLKTCVLALLALAS